MHVSDPPQARHQLLPALRRRKGDKVSRGKISTQVPSEVANPARSGHKFFSALTGKYHQEGGRAGRREGGREESFIKITENGGEGVFNGL